MQSAILYNCNWVGRPYEKLQRLVAIDREKGIDYIVAWSLMLKVDEVDRISVGKNADYASTYCEADIFHSSSCCQLLENAFSSPSILNWILDFLEAQTLFSVNSASQLAISESLIQNGRENAPRPILQNNLITADLPLKPVDSFGRFESGT